MRACSLIALVLSVTTLAPTLAAQSYVNFEGATTHPIRLSPDGSRLFAVNPADNKLEVYDLSDPADPVLLRVIPVGLEPVSVNVRSNDEAWVVNTISDSVSIVSVREGQVVNTIKLKDEPADVAFAGSPLRAFITTAATDTVHVYDVATLTLDGTIPIFGKDPRSLTVAGDSVYVLIMRSGNGTTVIPESIAPPQPPPTGGGLDPAPQASLVVAADDPTWAAQIPYTVPDIDIVEINANTLSIVREISGVGTNNYHLAVHPTSGELYVANTEARNLVRFENNLRGHAVDNQVTVVGTGTSPTITKIDLNPGVDYNTFPNLTALASALADPSYLLIDESQDRIYIASQGTDRLGIMTSAGAITHRIEVGTTPGTFVQPRAKRAPRGLALHPSAPWLYIYNRTQLSFTLFNTVSLTKGPELKLSYNPTPSDMHLGRKYIYDAKLSGNGTQSCVGCHVDGETDNLGWDLGVTDGPMLPPPVQPFPFDQALNPLTDFHPMKGPMATQSLRGLGGLEPFHWRGDRPDLESFNAGFTDLLVGDALVEAALALVVSWMDSVAYPPNPNRNLTNVLNTTPAGTNQQAGFDAFTLNIAGPNTSCASCHALPNGSNGMVISANFLQEAQQMKVPQLRNMYRKVGFDNSPGASKTGFGFTHDGAIDNLTTFLNLPQFNPWPSDTKDDIAEYLMAFDTGMAPIVGWQVPVGVGNALSAGVTTKLGLLEGQANAGDCDIVVKGTLDGQVRGMVYEPITGLYVVDRSDFGPYTTQDVRDLAAADRARWVFTGVPPGSGDRIGIDRDLDGAADGEDGLFHSGTPIPGCNGEMHLYGNRKPSVNLDGFALVVANAPPLSTGLLIVNRAPVQTAGNPNRMLRIPFGPTFSTQNVLSDAEGFAVARLPIPDNDLLIGTNFVAVAIFQDACGTLVSENLKITIRP